jgi:predicted amidophosphoribosyltransferase
MANRNGGWADDWDLMVRQQTPCHECGETLPRDATVCEECGTLVPQESWFMPDRVEEYYEQQCP